MDTITLDYGVHLSQSHFETGSFRDQQRVEINFPAQPVELDINWWAKVPTDTSGWGGVIHTGACAP